MNSNFDIRERSLPDPLTTPGEYLIVPIIGGHLRFKKSSLVVSEGLHKVTTVVYLWQYAGIKDWGKSRYLMKGLKL